MTTEKIHNFINGWFIGNFKPSLFSTNDFEVAIKQYKMHDFEEKHYHKIATEITVVVSGKIEMCNKKFTAGDIIVLDPGESTEFLAISESVTCCVVKVPCVANDKFLEK